MAATLAAKRGGTWQASVPSTKVRNMRPKRIVVGLTALAISASWAGCGGDDSSEPASEPAVTGESAVDEELDAALEDVESGPASKEDLETILEAGQGQ